MITKSKVTEIFVLPMISAKNLMQRWQKTLFNQHLMPLYDKIMLRRGALSRP